MSQPALFIGVVSHEGSRFAISQGPDGLAARLRDHWDGELTAEVRVNTENVHDPDALPVDAVLIQKSLSAQESIENAWMSYVRAGRPRGLRDGAKSLLRWGLRQWRRVRRPGPGGVTRLINIELSHVDLLRRGLASGAPWILIVEDDAYAADIADCGAGLQRLMQEAPSHVAYINVSESFPLSELGIEHLLTPAGATWAGTVNRDVLASSRPVTNTVCAILYRADFVDALLDEFDRMPMTPVIPIDWKLNDALMRMHADGRLGPGSCWLVSPAPIDQLSMRVAP